MERALSPRLPIYAPNVLYEKSFIDRNKPLDALCFVLIARFQEPCRCDFLWKIAVCELEPFFRCVLMFLGPHEQAVAKNRRVWRLAASLFAFRKVINGSVATSYRKHALSTSVFGAMCIYFLSVSLNHLTIVVCHT